MNHGKTPCWADRLAPLNDSGHIPRHGGNLGDAVRQYGRVRDAWLDLSTGINPHGYPIPTIPPEVWQRLPDDNDGLLDAAASYYDVPIERIAAAAGTQAIIRTLPHLIRPGRVAIAPLTYSEYAPAFTAAGHTLTSWQTSDDALPDADYVVCVNPNNPTTDTVPAATLNRWQAQLAVRGGLLVLDEAFADVTPHNSLAALTGEPGLVVLRSVGKFFGLAGLRAGFVLTAPALAQRIATALGAWTVNGPARFVVRQAFADIAWQNAMRQRLIHDGQRLAALLHAQGWPVRATPLFAWTAHAQAAHWHSTLAEHGIWTRLFDPPPPHAGHSAHASAHAPLPSLRIGLPGSEAQWARLREALSHLSR